MSLSIARLGDTSNHGGTIISANQVTAKANGILIAVTGANHSCPIQGHGVTSVSSSSKVKCEGKSIIRKNVDFAGCGALINFGSPNVFTV